MDFARFVFVVYGTCAVVAIADAAIFHGQAPPLLTFIPFVIFFTVFLIRLPVILIQQKELMPVRVMLSERYTVLMAEDNPVNQQVLCSMLDNSEFEIVMADNGKMALDHYISVNPDTIVMDFSMPEMDGLEVARAIRALEKERGLQSTPIIAAIANAMKTDRIECYAAGMEDYEEKLINRDTLLTEMRKWSGNKEEQ